MANYLTYPFKTMRITQNYSGSTSHAPHSTGNPKDFPLDEGGADGGRDWMCCPCDEMKVVKVYGVGGGGANTIWLTSTKKVIFANGTSDYVTIMCIHPEDEDLRKSKAGTIYKRGDKMFREGGDGGTVNGRHVQFGNHIHMAVGKGVMKGTGWTKNNKGKWVISTSGGAMKPEDAFLVDTTFTTVKNRAGVNFKTLQDYKKQEAKKPETKKTYTPGTYKVTTNDTLFVRKGPGITYTKVTYKNLTKDARTSIKKLAGKEVDGYVKGLEFTVTTVKYNKADTHYWGKTPSGWVALEYCKKIK